MGEPAAAGPDGWTPRGSLGAAGLLVLLLGAVPPAAAAQERPEGVTAETVERGRRIYLGDGFCHTCHGRDGRGLPELGAGLTGGRWTYSDGSLEGRVQPDRHPHAAPGRSRSGPGADPRGGGLRLDPGPGRARRRPLIPSAP